MIDLFRNTGYNARRLAEAADILKKMVESNATICLTISGALTPIGFGKMIARKIAPVSFHLLERLCPPGTVELSET